MKLQHIAAAVALVAAGTANAAIATGGNGSLVMIAYDKNPAGAFATTAGVFDLGLTIDDLIGSASTGTGATAASLAGQGANLSWNFNTNTISVNGVTTAFGGSNNWTAAWNTLLANSDAADLSFVVTGFDTVGFGAQVRSVVTGVAGSTYVFNGTQAMNLTQIAGGKQNDIFTPIATRGTNATDANGAYTFTAADGIASRANGYAMAGDGFANNWRNANQMMGETLVSNTTALWSVNGLGQKFQLNGTLSLNASAGVLSFAVPTVAPAVPEPSTYALMVAGLAVVGAVARRRRA